MSKVNYPASSPYTDSTQTSWYLLPIKLRTIPADNGDTKIVLDTRYEHRPDLLSYDLYATPAYWWVFMVRNMDDIRDPIWDLKSGMTIYAPTAERLHRLLG